MLHHDRHFVGTLQDERRAAAARRRPPADAGELERLVHAAAAGNPTAWSDLIERFSARIRSVARRHRLSAHDIDDVVQDTWLTLLRHIYGVRDPNAIGAWLETTARHESLKILRRLQREEPAGFETDSDEVPAATDEPRVDAAEHRTAVLTALERLPRRQRELLTMLMSDPAPSYHQISRALGMPVGSIGPTRGRAVARLRRDRGLSASVAEAFDESACARPRSPSARRGSSPSHRTRSSPKPTTRR
jgi:RNA polymerase sigma factor (sigma-70 family)